MHYDSGSAGDVTGTKQVVGLNCDNCTECNMVHCIVDKCIFSASSRLDTSKRKPVDLSSKISVVRV